MWCCSGSGQEGLPEMFLQTTKQSMWINCFVFFCRSKNSVQSFVLLHGTDCCARSKSHKIIMVTILKKAAFSPIIVCCELVKAAWWFARRLQCTEESVMSLKKLDRKWNRLFLLLFLFHYCKHFWISDWLWIQSFTSEQCPVTCYGPEHWVFFSLHKMLVASFILISTICNISDILAWWSD